MNQAKHSEGEEVKKNKKKKLAQLNRKQSESRLGFGIKTDGYILRSDCAKLDPVALLHAAGPWRLTPSSLATIYL